MNEEERRRILRKMYATAADLSASSAQVCSWVEKKFTALEIYFLHKAMQVTIPKEKQ